MSEPIPEAIPTATSRLSHRPTKKARSTNQALTQQSHSLAVLFANADREITLPPSPTNQKPQTATSALAAAPEIVPNVQGSSAGAGSGEFHVYKASRRREYERLKAMDEEVKAEEEKREWESRKVEGEKREEKRMSRNRARREKARERKANKGKRGISEGVDSGSGDAKDDAGPKIWKKGLAARKDLMPRLEDDVDNENGVQDVLDVSPTNQDNLGLTIHDDED